MTHRRVLILGILTLCAAFVGVGVSTSHAEKTTGKKKKGSAVHAIPHLQPIVGQAPQGAEDRDRAPMEPPAMRKSIQQLLEKVNAKQAARGAEKGKQSGKDKKAAEPLRLNPIQGQGPSNPDDAQLPPPPPALPRRTVEQLKQKFLEMPGKREAIQKMLKEKKEKTGWLEQTGDLLAWLNPFHVATAEAQYTINPSSTSTPLSTPTTTGLEWIAEPANGFVVREANGSKPLWLNIYNSSLYGSSDYARIYGPSNGYATVRFIAPVSGTYLISVNVYGNGKLTQGSTVIADWPAQSGWSDYVTTVYLSAGSYYWQYRPHSVAYLKEFRIAQVTY